MFGQLRFGNIGEYKNKLLANGRAFKPAIQQAIVEVLNESVEISKDAAPVDTGFMKSRIYGVMISETSCILVSEAHYSIFVNFGHFTRAGTFVDPQPFFSLGMLHFFENIPRRVIEKLLLAGAHII